MKPTKFEGIVRSIDYVTHDINKVNITLPFPVEFKAGSFAQIEIPAHAKEWEIFLAIAKARGEIVLANGREEQASKYHRLWMPPENHHILKPNPNFEEQIKSPTKRTYSIASDPTDGKHFDFLVRRVPGGIASNYIHLFLKVGQKINIMAPLGKFQVHYDTLAQNNGIMVCVAGGSGMAPFRSIFREMQRNGTIDKIPIWFFFGAATPRDLFYVDSMEVLHQKYRNFHYIPSLSGPPPFPKPADWTPPVEWESKIKDRLNANMSDIEVGTITDVMDRYLKDSGRDDRTKGDTIMDKYKEGYLCGSTGMLNMCGVVMTNNNMKEELIYFDKFG